MADKNSFIVRLELMEQLEMLSTDQIGALFMAMCRYVRDGDHPAFSDPMLKMLFSIVRAQLDRDAEKYEETCKARSEAGKRGGRPKKANGFSEKAKKANGFSEKQTKAKKADSECVCECDSECEPEPVPDCDPVCVPVCECDPECAVAQDTTHTHASINVENVLKLAEQFGYQWSRQEAEDFLAFNIDKGRTDGWSYAVQRWEKNRPKHGSGTGRGRRKYTKAEMTPEEIAKMNEYLSTANRFREDEEGANG